MASGAPGIAGLVLTKQETNLKMKFAQIKEADVTEADITIFMGRAKIRADGRTLDITRFHLSHPPSISFAPKSLVSSLSLHLSHPSTFIHSVDFAHLASFTRDSAAFSARILTLLSKSHSFVTRAATHKGPLSICRLKGKKKTLVWFCWYNRNHLCNVW